MDEHERTIHLDDLSNQILGPPLTKLIDALEVKDAEFRTSITIRGESGKILLDGFSHYKVRLSKRQVIILIGLLVFLTGSVANAIVAKFPPIISNLVSVFQML